MTIAFPNWMKVTAGVLFVVFAVIGYVHSGWVGAGMGLVGACLLTGGFVVVVYVIVMIAWMRSGSH